MFGKRVRLTSPSVSAIVGLVLLAGISGPASAQSSYRVVKLPVLPGYASSGASAANDTGAVVGFCQNGGGGALRPWYWRDTNGNGLADASELVDLGALAPAGTLSTGVSGVNASDQVAGVIQVPNTGDSRFGSTIGHGFVWRPGDPVLTDLNSLVDGAPANELWQVSDAGSINDTGVIAANICATLLDTDTITVHKALLHPTGTGRYTAQILYSALQAGAPYSLTSNGLALIWLANSADLVWDGAAIRSTGLEAGAVNSSGNLAGTLNGAPVFKTAFDGILTPIPLLGGNPTGVSDMNDDRTVVGYSTVIKRGAYTYAPYRWQPGGATIDLNKLIPKGSGITLLQVGRITTGGRIVGVGSTSSGNRGFLLIPNP